MLKRDQEILNNCIKIDEDGNLTVLFKPLNLIMNKAPKRSNSSSSADSNDFIDNLKSS